MDRRVLFGLLCLACSVVEFRVSGGQNVLFICVDDLRPALGCYGDPIAKTPNIDRLAEKGTVFERAYCQQGVCSPSRLSMLAGLRPDSIRVWDLKTHFRVAVPNAVTLPQYFKQNGYQTRSIGKIFHGSGPPSKDPQSWSVDPILDYVREPTLRYATPKNLSGDGLKRGAYESADVSDDVYTDGKVCGLAETALTSLAEDGEPFFLAVGFRKPHLPFCAPKRYWDLYDCNAIPLPSREKHPDGAPLWAPRSWRELEGYTDIPDDGQLDLAKVRDLRHGYYACVSYVDALVGRLIERLRKLGLSDETVVCLWGDHGFHLGEQGIWAKANNYEWSTRVPLVISVPGMNSKPQSCSALVELVDVYPTLAEVCGLPAPVGLEGVSMARLLRQPRLPWKFAAFSQFPRAYQKHRHEGEGDMMGNAIRTRRYRYVEWRRNTDNRILGRELYDHLTDADESINRAADAGYAARVEWLSERLQQGWRTALPLEN